MKMGNLFSSLNGVVGVVGLGSTSGSTSTSTTTSTTTNSEYLKTLQTLREQEEALYQAAQAAEQKRKEIVAASLKRQEEEATQRMNELNEIIRLAQEMNDSRKLLNIQASQLICAIYYNYQFGNIDEDDENWSNNVISVIDTCLNVNTFWLLCKIPQLLPLLWMTGTDCDAFHQYKLDAKGEPILSEHKLYIASNVEKYITTSLSTSLSNLCQSNCKKYLDINEERNNLIASKCKKYLSETENLMSDDEWVRATLTFIEDDDEMNWKCFAARSGKGITKSKIRLLPSSYPKICPKYELYCALLMVANTVINHYGDVRNGSGVRVSSSLSSHTNGGQCFELNESWLKNSYKKAFDFSTIWDGESYIDVSTWSSSISEKDITGSAETETWMKKTSLHSKTHIYGKNADGSGGYLKYVNPTQLYTHQFINDIDNVEVAFQMTRLSAGINDNFTKNFLFNIFNSLTTNKDYSSYNVYNTENKNLLTAIDYIYIIPSGFEQVDNVSPICRYLFEVLVKHSCKWFITIPIESSMSMMKINSVMLSGGGGSGGDNLPQYAWSGDGGDSSSNSTSTSKKLTTTFTFDNVEPSSVEIK